jgi:hypothetical protein
LVVGIIWVYVLFMIELYQELLRSIVISLWVPLETIRKCNVSEIYVSMWP